MEYQRNISTTPQNNETIQYNTKNNCSIFKRKFKPQNLNFQLRVETFFIPDVNYLFI